MEELQTSEESGFVVDEVNNIIKESIEQSLQNTVYNHNKVSQWTANVVELCLKKLTALNKPFKYVVTNIIMQKNGAGLHTASSCFWDNSTDGTYRFLLLPVSFEFLPDCFVDGDATGSCTVRWENKTMYCIVTVFGLSI
eukprot:Sdes_comp20101_c0_seq1m13098